ncbi:hypothetical protein ABZS96_43595, partial [Streptomyces avermitilis]|uniref:hypothetical protein n=1 Tax=Streptomyces avermitilis TaxID=33903 RepID=UPI0033BFA20E
GPGHTSVRLVVSLPALTRYCVRWESLAPRCPDHARKPPVSRIAGNAERHWFNGGTPAGAGGA